MKGLVFSFLEKFYNGSRQVSLTAFERLSDSQTPIRQASNRITGFGQQADYREKNLRRMIQFAEPFF